MGTKQKCEWECDLCKKVDYSYSNDHSPNNWCRATVSVLYNGGQFGRGVMSRNEPEQLTYIDICDDCFDGEYQRARSSFDQTEIKESFAKRLCKYFKITKDSQSLADS